MLTFLSLALALLGAPAQAFAPVSLCQRAAAPSAASTVLRSHSADRRGFMSQAAIAISGAVALPRVAGADVDTEDFIKTGMVSMPMGVSGQAGKAKPVTGVVLREGSEVSRDGRGSVLAEILVGGKSSDPTPVLATFSSPWPLAKGGLFDVECRDASTGDGAFLTVAKGKGKGIADLPKTFFTESLFSSTGRFSFYGAPTDVKVKKSDVDGQYRILEIVFSNLSQSTNAEIPRTAVVAATIPEGTDDVVMLVGSATSNRWKRGAEKAVRDTVGSFKATLAPTSGMKVRAKGSA
ncbi:hypothetical protein ACHAXT_010150 [Thalassiosira profunda]